jgi:hypothetical protein
MRVRPGLTIGKTDDLGLAITEDSVHVNDLQATILHCLGLDHTRLTYRYMGRNFRLTDVRVEIAVISLIIRAVRSKTVGPGGPTKSFHDY